MCSFILMNDSYYYNLYYAYKTDIIIITLYSIMYYN